MKYRCKFEWLVTLSIVSHNCACTVCFLFSQDMVTQASPYLFEATEKRFYFKNVAILIPETWKKKSEYVRPKLETFKNVRISSSFFKFNFLLWFRFFSLKYSRTKWNEFQNTPVWIRLIHLLKFCNDQNFFLHFRPMF